MKRLLFISLFLLLKCVTTNAQNQRISVDVWGIGRSLVQSLPTNNVNSYSLTYEKTEENKSWGIRASFFDLTEVHLAFLSNTITKEEFIREIKLIGFRKEYGKKGFAKNLFWGYYGSLSHLTHEFVFLTGNPDKPKDYSESGVNIGMGFLTGVSILSSEHAKLELVIGLGAGLLLNSAFNNSLIYPLIMSPSFLDVNFCYEF
jgi:hypothetical protein